MRYKPLIFLRIKLFWAVISLGLLTSACQSPSARFSQDRPALPSRVSGSSDEAMMQMQRELNKQGIQVISMGQNYLVSIPSHDLFANESPRLKGQAYAVLNDVSCYLKQFRKVAVTIRSFSNPCASIRREKALTLTRARAVGDYLVSQGIDARLIFTEGLGSDKPIVSSRKGGDSSPNSRVEIIFRRAVA